MVTTVQSVTEGHEGTLRTGDLVSAYRIENLVGTGGMGWVYRARHALNHQLVALKVLREDQLAIDRSVDRMMREASILASVSHPGIPRFFECGVLSDGRPWIAMELVEGSPLSERIQQQHVLPHEEVLEILGSVSAVLAAAHRRGVTHRDLKPDNIFLTPNDPAFPVRVIDWGIAHHLAGARYTNMNEAIGTPTYMSPEQARGGPTEGHCDVYGLGVVAYQALAGRPPFLGATSVEILVQHLNKPIPALAPRCPDAPWGLVDLVERMLIKNFEHRPTATDVLAAIAKLRETTSEPTYHYFQFEDSIPGLVDGDETPATAQLRAQVPADD
ncbi:MAG TPA: serine/threonine-protein kinase [Kofleriaceae bacterium]|nr:serine/threonine-protein kinase [Kofleriaceae bacterium]